MPKLEDVTEVCPSCVDYIDEMAPTHKGRYLGLKESYTLNQEAVEKLREIISDYEIVAVFADWCGDARKAVPVLSLLEEAFGLVVIEGLACGCSVVASNRGGIPEALGGFGILYEAGDADALCLELKRQLAHCTPFPMGKIENHLKHHKPAAVAAEYEKLLFGGSI